MRWFGLDVHRDFCEVAIADDEAVRSAGRVPTRVEIARAICGEPGRNRCRGSPRRQRERTGSSRYSQAHGIRVVVANTRKLQGLSDTRARNRSPRREADRADAGSGLLDEVWTPDERRGRCGG